MKNEKDAALLRLELDILLKKFRRVPPAPPKGGWISNIRMALSMTGGDLARRMDISESSVSSMQESETKETISLSTLRRAAKAMNCTLVYAIVPKKSLERTLIGRRKTVAIFELTHHLSLSEAGKPVTLFLVDAYAKKIKANRVWKDLPKPEEIEAIKNRDRQTGAATV